jgi:hypothetical protein
MDMEALGIQPPNLFDFATSELSQDAFICWLASWADRSCQVLNGQLHRTATAFLDRLLEVGNGLKVSEYRSIEIRQQWNDIDVLVLVNGDIAIIIEDKTNSEDHSDQLVRYKKRVAKGFPDYTIVSIYLKTGDQCDYRSAAQAGYGCFLRRDFLDILKKGKDSGVTNSIFADFHRHLQSIEEAVQSFPDVPPQDWKRKQWMGFFTALREKLGDGEWEVRGHAGGSSLPFRWHWREDKLLALSEGKLIFKIEVKEKMHRKAKWVEWNQLLMAKSGTSGINLIKPKRKLGKRMTVAVLDGDYRQRDNRGLLDLPRTVDMLRRAEALMDAALGL